MRRPWQRRLRSVRSVRDEEQERRLGRAGVEEAIEAAGHSGKHVEERQPRRARRQRRRPDRADPARGTRTGTRGATMRRFSSAASPRGRGDRRAARTRAPRARPRGRAPRQMRSARSSASSMSRGTSVSSAIENPGSRSASSGKLAQQRQAERVDRADGDVRRPIAQLAPACRRDLAARRALPQRGHDALAHLGGRLARERDGEDVRRIDAGAQQVDVAIDEHARLAGAGRRLERDVEARDRRRARGRRGRARRCATRPSPASVVERQQEVTRRRRSPCGRPTRTRSSVHIIGSCGRGGNSPPPMPSSTANRRSRAAARIAPGSRGARP